jgi:hypothetical protein
VDFQRADAYVVLLPELTKLIVPAGVGNLAHNLPTVDMRVLAFTAIVAVREDPHPEDALPEWHHASGIRAGRPSASGFHCAVSGPGPSAVRPEPRANLTRYHGVLACAARLKPPLARAGHTSQTRLSSKRRTAVLRTTTSCPITRGRLLPLFAGKGAR